MTPPKQKNSIQIDECNRYACLVNRTTVIDTLEAKANVTGFRYTRPPTIPTELQPVTSKKGEFLYYQRTETVKVLDVDGKVKKTVRTSYFLQDKITPYPKKKPEIGVWTEGLAGRYHGRKSANWKQGYLTLHEIIETLNSGYAIAPGEFQAPKGESIRSAEHCEHRQFILLDADAWNSEHLAQTDIDKLIQRYPDITTDFYWIGESISSRSSLKPELRCRLMLVLPSPIKKGEETLWETAIDSIVEKYPFIARGVGVDKVRLSFGNARPECKNRIFGGIISEQMFENWKVKAEQEQERKEKEKQENAALKEKQAERRKADQKLRTELTKRGHNITGEPKDPITEFINTSPETLLQNWGIATHLNENEYNFVGSGAGRSLVLTPEGIIKPFSNTAQQASPAEDPTSPVNAHRFIAYCQFGLDLTKQSERYDLRCSLHAEGFGDPPDAYKEYQKKINALARKEGLSPTRHAPQKLKIDPNHITKSEQINVIRLQNDERFTAWIQRTQETDEQHLLIFATAAGTGKTTLTILKIDKSVDVSPITELADAKFEKAIEAGKHAVRHRPRHFNHNAVNKDPHTQSIGLYGGNEVPCVFPFHCNALAARGYNPITTFCFRCPRQSDCEDRGYLSQYRKLAQYDQIFVAWNEGILTDPNSAAYITRLTENGDYVGVLDEVDPADLCPQRSYMTFQIEKLYNQFRFVDCEAGVFLRKFLKQTATATTAAEYVNIIRDLLSEYDTETLEQIDDEILKFPVEIQFEKAKNPETDLRGNVLYHNQVRIIYAGKTITAAVLNDYKESKLLKNKHRWVLRDEVYPARGFNYDNTYTTLLSFNTLLRLRFISLDTPEHINLIPRRIQNFTTDLKAFVESVGGETPPAERTETGWDYYLPPSLNMRRAVFISASGVVNTIKQLYKQSKIDISTIEAPPPAWQNGCKLYQISTGRYTPNQSLIEKDENSTPAGLKHRAVEMLKIIETVATKQKEKKIFVVAPKAFTENGELSELPEIKRIHDLPNVTMINHAHAEGVNTYEHHEISFIFGYEIPPTDLERIARTIYRTETLKFDRKENDLNKGGVILEKALRYTDKRVRQIHEKSCESVLMQAITRQRQMIHEKRTCYLFTSEPISRLPTMPILFTLQDMQACLEKHNTLDNFESFITKQDERSVKEIAEQENVSERHARRRTQKKRNDEKQELTKAVLRLKNKGFSIRKIAVDLNISRGKVERILS